MSTTPRLLRHSFAFGPDTGRWTQWPPGDWCDTSDDTNRKRRTTVLTSRSRHLKRGCSAQQLYVPEYTNPPLAAVANGSTVWMGALASLSRTLRNTPCRLLPTP